MEISKLISTMESICSQHGWPLGNFYILRNDNLDCSGQEFCLKNPFLGSYQRESQKYTFQIGVGLPGRVWQNLNYEWVDNVQNLDGSKYARLGLAKELGVKACLGVPYKQNGTFMGVMEFFDINEKKCDSSMVEDIMKKCDE
jgi:two-component system sensor histidine kinase/response regulator